MGFPGIFNTLCLDMVVSELKKEELWDLIVNHN